VLRVHCELIGLDRAAWEAEIKDALGIVGLADRADDRIGGYSKGMQQRLGLGVALLGRPALVLLDEPTSALDPVGRHDVREVIRALKARGTTVFLNSHLLTEVEQVCDRVAIVDKGRVIQVGTLDELLTTDAVRVRATGLENGGHDALRAFGELQDEGEWIVVRGINAERVPDLVRAIVERGGRVYAVEPRHESLEDRFLSLLEKPRA
jgi:ABC-2 type transport system ATP-binding protein